MAKKTSNKSNGANDFFAQIAGQFKGLNDKDPVIWPAIPKYLLCLFIAVGVAVALWFALLQDYKVELETEQAKELVLREDYQKKLVKAVSLDALKKQREQIQLFVIQLEKQLPSKSEMAALLSDINQAGLGRSLQFDLFRPGEVVLRDYYAELPIAVRVIGKYHDMGAFASDVAHLSRIVTLNNISIEAVDKDSTLLKMDATARTFRYLDPEEILAQKQAQQNNAQQAR